jgi:carbon starvation protein
MQEFLGRFSAELGRSSSRTGGALASGLIVAGWGYFILTGNISTIWPMFGVANQLLACTALCVGTTIVLREAPLKRYALVTFLPLCFLSVTTLAGGVESVRRIYLPMAAVPATRVTGWVNAIVVSFLIVGVTFVIVGSARRWLAQLRSPGLGARAEATS